MSLINKMLQDLDARGSQGGEFIDMDVKSVVSAEPRISTPIIAGVLAGVIALAAAGVYGWRYFKQPAAVTPVAAAPAPVTVARAQVAVPAPTPVATPAQSPAPAPAAMPAPVTPAAPAPVRKELVPAAAPEATDPRPARQAAQPRPAPVRAAQAIAPTPAATEGRQLSSPRSAQAQYAAALGRLQEGRIEEAMAGLEQALQIDPRHEAARQTLVGLLIEDNRADQAMVQLQAGLALDPRQPQLAMLLARMQIERGNSGVDTLLRSLPAAAGNGDYHALLAGALQREGRHADSAEQYLAALRTAPQNGVWLMGLGISLQGAQRDADAVDAFQRAKASGTLSPQLSAFVERKLQQLAR